VLIYIVLWFQILISGSHEGMDVDDLRKNAHYAGGYDEVCFKIHVLQWSYYLRSFVIKRS